MIGIRGEQMSAVAEDGLLARLQTFLHDAFPESREVPAAQMKAALRGQVQRSQGYGAVTERQVASYVVTAWLLGERFDEEHPAAAEILAADDDPDTKMLRLEDWTLALLRALEG